MNMSDEVTGAALQVATRAAESGMHMIDRTIDLIAKLLQMLSEIEKNRQINSGSGHSSGKGKDNSVKSTDLTELKPGTVKMRDLISDAKKNGDTLSASEQGLTKEDMKYIAKKSKEYGIPVAFTGTEGKDNLYANVRTSDLQIFQRICTDMMKEKLAERPQELGNFKIQEWEMPFIINELNKHDLSAQFGKTRDGEYFCLYEKSDEKAIHIARNEFVRKCSELKTELSFDKNEQGFYTLKDNRSGREISFDNVPTREELASQIHEKFGYDENKSRIACAKFGEECLKGQEKQQFFSDNPQKEFSRIDANIHVENESILTKEFSCWHMTPKTDHVPRIVFQNPENGKFAVLNPEKMTHRQMATALREHLGLEDKKQINALIDKAEKVSDYYVREENSELNYEFKKTDFDMTNPEVVSEMRRTDDEGNVFTKSLPVSSVSNAIERTDKDNFSVEITVGKVETDQNNKEYPSSDTRVLQLSFSDKKDALFQMTQLYKRQGMPEHIAKQMAKDVFRMAETQNPEKVVLIEEVKENTVVFSHHDKKAEIIVSEPEKAVKEISDKFDISEADSEQLLKKASENYIDGLVNEHLERLKENEPVQNPEFIPDIPEWVKQMSDDPYYTQEPDSGYIPEEPEWFKQMAEEQSLNMPLDEPPFEAMPDMPYPQEAFPENIPDMPPPPSSFGGRR